MRVTVQYTRLLPQQAVQRRPRAIRVFVQVRCDLRQKFVRISSYSSAKSYTSFVECKSSNWLSCFVYFLVHAVVIATETVFSFSVIDLYCDGRIRAIHLNLYSSVRSCSASFVTACVWPVPANLSF